MGMGLMAKKKRTITKGKEEMKSVVCGKEEYRHVYQEEKKRGRRSEKKKKRETERANSSIQKKEDVILRDPIKGEKNWGIKTKGEEKNLLQGGRKKKRKNSPL